MKKGFTLVELLIGIAVIAVISVIAMRMIYNLVNYRSKQFAIEDTSDSFRDFITNISNSIKNSAAITVGNTGNDIEIEGDECVSYRFNISDKTIDRSEGSEVPCNTSYQRMLENNIEINKFLLSPTGSGVNSVNIDIQGLYKDSLGEKPFSYYSTITKRL